MRIGRYLAAWLASVELASAADSCFLNYEWPRIVPGQPVLLAWDDLVGSFWDILLNTDVRTRASLVGPIARNITQNAVVWVPPDDIAGDDPDKLFAVQLWDLSRGTSCNSPSFSFKKSDEPAQPLPPGPFVTTGAPMVSGTVVVTATVASFTSSAEASYSSSVPTTTTTGKPEEAAEAAPPTNVTAIVVGVVFGTLVVVLVVLSVLLWRAKRKRARNRGTLLPSDDGKGGGRDDAMSPTPTTPAHPIELESGAFHKAAEMQADEPRHELNAASSRYVAEMPAEPVAPVELPADVPEGNLAAPARRQSLVSALTSDSRRSSLDRFPVSPSTLTMRRTSLNKS